MLVYGKYECFVMQMFYVCVMCASCGSSQCCMTFSLLILVEDARGDHNYALQNWSHSDSYIMVLLYQDCCSSTNLHMQKK